MQLATADVIQVFLLALLGSIIALVGGVVFLAKRSWSQWLTRHSVPFAAGVLLTVSLLGLLPEAVEMAGEQAYSWVLAAFLVAFGFEHLFFGLHHHDGNHAKGQWGSVPLVIAGDTIHNFIDGLAIAASYLVHPGLGLITAVSTFLHEVPHEIGDFGILLRAGWRRRAIVVVNLLSASTTFLGAGFVLFISDSSSFEGVLLAVAAGMFLYLGASDFLPQVAEEREGRKRLPLALFIGVVVMLMTIFAVPHAHGEEIHDESYEEAGELEGEIRIDEDTL